MKLNNFELWPIIFVTETGNMKWQRLPDGGGEVCNVASNADMCAVCFIFLYPSLYFDFLSV
jgi:hypothetical protein